MNKVNTLFKKYYRILNEQEPATAEPAPAPDATMPPEPAMDMEPIEPEKDEPEVKENEKVIIKILANAFIFNKLDLDPETLLRVERNIRIIKDSVGWPMSKTISAIINILCLNPSLCLKKSLGIRVNKESKIEKAFLKYKLMYEVAADATDGPANPNKENEKDTESPGNEIVSLSLSEIFPEYQELILRALEYVPTAEEIMILRPVVKEFGENNPTAVETTVKNLLNLNRDSAISSNILKKNQDDINDTVEDLLVNIK